MNQIYHEHPIKILKYSAKNLWLLIFPLLRGLRFYPFSLQNLIDWGAGAWFDLLIALFILGLGALRWYCCRYQFNSNTIYAKSGFFLTKETVIPLERITVTTEEHLFYLRPLRAVVLQVSTASGVQDETSMRLILRLRDLHHMRPNIPVLQNDSQATVAYHSPAWRMLLFSALFSSSFSGAIYIAALFVQGGRMTADLLEEFRAQQLLENATRRASTVFRGVPRAAITLGIIILSLWLISFFRNLLRYGRFRIRFGRQHISVHMGILARRRFHLRNNAILYTDLRQNLVMKLCGMVSLHIRCCGYGGRRDTLPVLIPLIRKCSARPLLQRFSAVQDGDGVYCRAGSKPLFFWSFLWQPVIGLVALLPLRWILVWMFPQVRSLIRFVLGMLVIPLGWLLLIRTVSLFCQYISLDPQTVQLHFSRGFTFHTMTVQKERVVRVDIVQNFFQKRYGVCHVYLMLQGPRKKRYKLTALPLDAARKLADELTFLS